MMIVKGLRIQRGLWLQSFESAGMIFLASGSCSTGWLSGTYCLSLSDQNLTVTSCSVALQVVSLQNLLSCSRVLPEKEAMQWSEKAELKDIYQTYCAQVSIDVLTQRWFNCTFVFKAVQKYCG
jgi:hypothetical protein